MGHQAATIGTTWDLLLGAPEWERLLEWPPDVFALTDRILDASEAYRFVVSAPDGREWHGYEEAAPIVAQQWWAWLDGDATDPPEWLSRWWKRVVDARDVPIADLARGEAWDVCEAVLALHAAADEACAGLGSALSAPAGPGHRFRAHAREVFAATGSLSRVSREAITVLPKCRASSGGISIRSVARHVCVRTARVEAVWHRILSTPSGVGLRAAHMNVLLLPWPLQVRATDFHTVDWRLPNMDPATYAFFEFAPPDDFDFDLADRLLREARHESGTVDAVVLPEGALLPEHIEPLEELLHSHGAWALMTGVRELAREGTALGRNYVHVGVRQDSVWRHVSQDKHHRWCLDPRQINQYHLGASLDPTLSTWEAVAIPPRSLQLIDMGAGVTIVPLVCEDLARLEPVSDLLRALAPSLVFTLLLDGPQLSSRWTSRYASVLADDPGCAVCTLTSFGMVQRCRPSGHAPSRVVALWKDPTGGLAEIELEPGAAGVLLTLNMSYGDSWTADGRFHQDSTTDFSLVAVHQVHPDRSPDEVLPQRMPTVHDLPTLDEREIIKATSWAEALAETAFSDPDGVHALFDDALATDWRDELGLPRPGKLFVATVELMRGMVPAAPVPITPDLLLQAARQLVAEPTDAARMTGIIVGIAVAQHGITMSRKAWAMRAHQVRPEPQPHQ